jgi:hypothetical protein
VVAKRSSKERKAQVTVIHCPAGGLVGFNEADYQLVIGIGSSRYDPNLHCSLIEFKPGWFALYAPGRTFPLVVTDEWDAVLDAYRARPPYVAHRGAPSVVPIGTPKSAKGINLDKLAINI